LHLLLSLPSIDLPVFHHFLFNNEWNLMASLAAFQSRPQLIPVPGGGGDNQVGRVAGEGNIRGLDMDSFCSLFAGLSVVDESS
jgi:hypothetical protein